MKTAENRLKRDKCGEIMKGVKNVRWIKEFEEQKHMFREHRNHFRGILGLCIAWCLFINDQAEHNPKVLELYQHLRCFKNVALDTMSKCSWSYAMYYYGHYLSLSLSFVSLFSFLLFFFFFLNRGCNLVISVHCKTGPFFPTLSKTPDSFVLELCVCVLAALVCEPERLSSVWTLTFLRLDNHRALGPSSHDAG